MNSMRALSALHGLSRISDTDFSKLTHKEQLDQYARQAADVTKVVLLNKALDKLVPGLKTNTSVSSEPASSRATAENPIAVTPEGVPVKVAPEKAPDTSVLKNAAQGVEGGVTQLKLDANQASVGSVIVPRDKLDIFKHQYKYHNRIRERALQDPIAHNFPYSFDDVILKSNPIIQKDGSLLYRCPGSLNGKDGFFELAINEKDKTIFHRTFIENK